MYDATLAADWNATLTSRPTAPTRISSLLSALRPRLGKIAGAVWPALVQGTFALFMGSLVALLILLYSGILLV
jgi:hypothetical protein